MVEKKPVVNDFKKGAWVQLDFKAPYHADFAKHLNGLGIPLDTELQIVDLGTYGPDAQNQRGIYYSLFCKYNDTQTGEEKVQTVSLLVPTEYSVTDFIRIVKKTNIN